MLLEAAHQKVAAIMSSYLMATLDANVRNTTDVQGTK